MSRGKGWFGESYRHSLAARGIRSGRKSSTSMKNTPDSTIFQRQFKKQHEARGRAVEQATREAVKQKEQLEKTEAKFTKHVYGKLPHWVFEAKLTFFVEKKDAERAKESLANAGIESFVQKAPLHGYHVYVPVKYEKDAKKVLIIEQMRKTKQV